MKKTVVLALFSAFTFVAANGHCDSGAATAGSRSNGPDAGRHAHRARLIAERKANPPSASSSAEGESKVSKFWKNEAERSGVSNWKVPSLNPMPWLRDQERRYEERKAASK